mmetsp:Transcript_5613/g.13855  ORF Transcript_5613/g.13855 Transcript_5613/m.13855 type:complete len:232 (-) Transcript_5613:802-1497(-)
MFACKEGHLHQCISCLFEGVLRRLAEELNLGQNPRVQFDLLFNRGLVQPPEVAPVDGPHRGRTARADCGCSWGPVKKRHLSEGSPCCQVGDMPAIHNDLEGALSNDEEEISVELALYDDVYATINPHAACCPCHLIQAYKAQVRNQWAKVDIASNRLYNEIPFRCCHGRVIDAASLDVIIFAPGVIMHAGMMPEALETQPRRQIESHDVLLLEHANLQWLQRLHCTFPRRI